MSCERSPAQLSLYLDGELAPPEAHEMAQHLQTCHVCQAEVAAHRRLPGLLPTPHPPRPEEGSPGRLWPPIPQPLVQEARTTPPRPARRPRHRLWLSLGACVALLLGALAVRLWLTPPVPLVVQEVVDSQIRTRLMRVPYTQMPATPDAIRRWFDDKVDFAVLVPALPQARYAFLGA